MPKVDKTTVIVNVSIRDNIQRSCKRISLFRIQFKFLATSDKMKEQKPIVVYKGFYFGLNMFVISNSA